MQEKCAYKRRPAPIPYRPPKDRTAEFHARVAASGLTTNAFITERIFGRGRRQRAALRMLARLLDETARIGSRLDDIAAAGVEDHMPALDAAQQELAQIRAALLTEMGRSP